MLACRACRTPIAALTGCAVCVDFKANLIELDDSPEERPSLADVGHESVAALRQMLREARGVLEQRKPVDATPEWHRRRDAAHNLVVKVSNSLAKVLEAARKLQTDGLAAIRNMSFLERAELFISWYALLPPPARESVQQSMAKFEESLKPKELTA